MNFSINITTDAQLVIDFYRPQKEYKENHLLETINVPSSGVYDITNRVHKRYYDVEVKSSFVQIKLKNIDMDKYKTDFIEIYDEISDNETYINYDDSIYSSIIPVSGFSVKTNVTGETELSMQYVRKSNQNEHNFKLFKCAEWDFSQKECFGDWNEIAGTLDTKENKINASISSFSSYVIGEVKDADEQITIPLSSPPSGEGGGSSGGSSQNLITDVFVDNIQKISEKLKTYIEETNDFKINTKSISKQM